MRVPPASKYGLLGFGAGAAVSVLFFPLNFLLALVLLLWLLVRLFRRAPGVRVKHLVAGGIGLATVAVAIVLPVKQLDGRVDPFRYERMSLDELCQTLGRDHHVLVSADRWTGTNVVDAFATERVMTRREVLGQLAQAANCELHIGYCGTGATFLFGAHPSFTRLYARAAQPNGLSQ
jgi:hypothetical protein